MRVFLHQAAGEPGAQPRRLRRELLGVGLVVLLAALWGAHEIYAQACPPTLTSPGAVIGNPAACAPAAGTTIMASPAAGLMCVIAPGTMTGSLGVMSANVGACSVVTGAMSDMLYAAHCTDSLDSPYPQCWFLCGCAVVPFVWGPDQGLPVELMDFSVVPEESEGARAQEPDPDDR